MPGFLFFESTAMQTILQILKVNELRSGVSHKSGAPKNWEMQDCECIVLGDDGSVQQVGVLPLGSEMRKDPPKPGVYIGTFALRAGMQDRRIGAVLVGLQPYGVKGGGVVVGAAKAAKDA